MLQAIDAWSLNHLGYTYLVIFVLSAFIYHQAFSRKLPILKNVLVYLVLAVGCLLLTFMQMLRFPIILIMVLTVIMVVVTKWRVWVSKAKETQQL